MDIKSLLNQALKSDLVKQGTQKLSQGSSSLSSLSKGSNNNGKSSSKSTLGAFGAGAVGGGLLGALMGSKKTKKMGKKAAGIGGAAALGALAYKVYNDYQSKQGQTPNSEQAQFDENDSNHSVLILRSMIAASKADGHIDEEEMARAASASNRIAPLSYNKSIVLMPFPCKIIKRQRAVIAINIGTVIGIFLYL